MLPKTLNTKNCQPPLISVNANQLNTKICIPPLTCVPMELPLLPTSFYTIMRAYIRSSARNARNSCITNNIVITFKQLSGSQNYVRQTMP